MSKKIRLKPRFSLFVRQVMEFLLLSLAVTVFFYFFLSLSCRSIGEAWLENRGITLNAQQWALLGLWTRNLCLTASLLVFLALFLFLLGQRIAYLDSIIRGVARLRETQLDASIPVEGEDEFALLAESINYLAASQRDLREKEDALRKKREDFVRALSHDIRTPLSSILSYSQYLSSRQPLTQEETAAFLSLVQSKAEQIRYLTDQLLGKAESSSQMENVLLLLQQLALEWEESLEDTFSCHTSFEDCQPFKGAVDLYGLRRIFDNLASNIEKYADPQKPVFLKIRAAKGEILIIQSNTTAANAQGESSRIGLESIRQIAKSLQGKAEVSSSCGSFEIRILLKTAAL